MSRPEDSAGRLGDARLRALLAFARLNLVVIERPGHIPSEAWDEITEAAADLVEADGAYRYPDLSAAEGPGKLFTHAEVMSIIAEWESAARFNLEQAREDQKPESYYLGMVDTLAHVRDDFERRARHAW